MKIHRFLKIALVAILGLSFISLVEARGRGNDDDGQKSGGAPNVIDANGQVIGPLIDIGTPYVNGGAAPHTVLYRTGEYIFPVEVAPAGVDVEGLKLKLDPGKVYYTDVTCGADGGDGYFETVGRYEANGVDQCSPQSTGCSYQRLESTLRSIDGVPTLITGWRWFFSGDVYDSYSYRSFYGECIAEYKRVYVNYPIYAVKIADVIPISVLEPLKIDY
jgi:hypothetical protein